MTVLDTLKLSRALHAAGMAAEQADAVTEAINDAFTGQVAEKRDLDALGSDLRAEIAAVREELKTEIAALRAELKTEIAGVRSEIAGVRAELKTEIAGLRGELTTEIAGLGARLTFQQWQLGAIFAVLLGLLIKLVVFHP